MDEKIVVGFDGSDNGSQALDFAAAVAKAHGATLVVAHVLEWSPYSFLTPTEIEERHKRRVEELGRAEKAVIEPVVARLNADGVEARGVLKYGHIAETLLRIAEEEGAKQLIIGRSGDSGLSSRLFGSVASSLAQAATVPLTIVP